MQHAQEQPCLGQAVLFPQLRNDSYEVCVKLTPACGGMQSSMHVVCIVYKLG